MAPTHSEQARESDNDDTSRRLDFIQPEQRSKSWLWNKQEIDGQMDGQRFLSKQTENEPPVRLFEWRLARARATLAAGQLPQCCLVAESSLAHGTKFVPTDHCEPS